jgi:outer membrane protein OmpA-like peptidoglycan-associated protein
MRPGNSGLRDLRLLAVALIGSAALMFPLRAQTALTTDDIVSRLGGLETAPDLDLAALRQRALDRIKSKAEAVPLKRPPVTTELRKLPQITLGIKFDPDTSIVRPESYQSLGRIADALMRQSLLPYGILIVGHTESTGKRDYNLTLSQRRADSIRDVLVTTFKISPKRIQAIGLGEEQLLDAAQPSAAINQQYQIMTVAKAP